MRRLLSFLILGIMLCITYLPMGWAEIVGVGTINGSFDVSVNGTANYSVAIEVPPGVGGMQPSLSLVYSSQAGNGLVGMGWSLAGLSTIHRCAKTYAQDNEHGGINFDQNDRLCLDGQQLVVVSGTYWADNSEYRTEQDSFSRITAHIGANGNIAWFSIQTKAGQTMEYGTTDDSRIEAQGKIDVMIWAVKEVRDAKDNRLIVNYIEDNVNGFFLADTIDYTDNLSATPALSAFAQVKFEYEDRPDVQEAYMGGSKITMPKRLKSITTLVLGTMVRKYSLTYNVSSATQRSRLSQIDECDASNVCKAATTLDWKKSNLGFLQPEQWMSDYPVSGGRPYSYEGRHTSMVDVNGDGLTDRIWVPSGRNDLWVALSTGTGFTTPEQWMPDYPVPNGRPYSWDGFHTSMADVNGDGLTDRIWVPKGRNDLWVVLSTGTGFTTPEQWMPDYPVSGVRPYSWDGLHTRMADVNGDGLTDRIWVPSGRNDLWVALSTGTGFTTPEQWMPDYPVSGVRPYSYDGLHTRMADVNGDGLPDRIWVPSGRNDLWVALTQSASADMLETITDGLGNRTDIQYKPLTDSSVYTKGSTADCANIFPEQCIQPPSYVVSDYQATNGIGGTASYTYQYTDLRVNLLGRGILGFGQFEKLDEQANIRTVSRFNRQGQGTVSSSNLTQDYANVAYYPYLGMTEQVISTYLPTNATLTDATSHYDHFTTQGSAFFSFSDTGTQTKYELDGTEVTKVTTLTQYNNGAISSPFANATLVRSTITDVQTNESYINNTVSTFFPEDTVNWHIGRLKSSTVTHTGHGDIQIRQSSFSYNSEGLLAQTKEEPGDPVFELTTTYDYDDYGNKKTVTVSGPGIATRSTQSNFVAGTLGTLTPQIQTSNALGQSETKTFDARFGVTRFLTGPNGLTTQWRYDGFGRKTQEIRADGNITSFDRQWCNGACYFPNALFQVTTETTGGTPSVEFYDILGRKIGVHTVGLNGQNIYAETVYDSKGRVGKTSRPYFQGDTPIWTTNEFDVLDRVKKTYAPTGTVTEFIHNKLTTTVKITNPSSVHGSSRTTQTIKTVYADGKSRRIEDTAGDITEFFYDAVGNLTRVEAIGGTTTMSYDKKGKKIGMTDPNMGQWDYQYDALGNLSYQKDAKLNEVKFLYDDLNRQVLRIEAEGATVWQYDTQTMGIGKLAKVTGPIPLSASEHSILFNTPNVATALSFSSQGSSNTVTVDSNALTSTVNYTLDNTQLSTTDTQTTTQIYTLDTNKLNGGTASSMDIFTAADGTSLADYGYTVYGDAALSIVNNRVTSTMGNSTQVALAPTAISDADFQVQGVITSRLVVNSGFVNPSLALYITDGDWAGYSVKYVHDYTNGYWHIMYYDDEWGEASVASVLVDPSINLDQARTVTLDKTGDTLTVLIDGNDIGLSYTDVAGLPAFTAYGVRSAYIAASDDIAVDNLILITQVEGGAYIVQPGDTWESIATNLYGSSAVAGDLQANNPPLADGLPLTYLPGTITQSITNTVTVPPYYTVQSGDTWASIATLLYGTANVSDELQTSLSNPTLTPGAQLTGFLTTLADDDNTPYYLVVSGDTWTSIANTVYGDAQAEAALKDYFDITDSTPPTVGAQLQVPASLTYTVAGGFVTGVCLRRIGSS